LDIAAAIAWTQIHRPPSNPTAPHKTVAKPLSSFFTHKFPRMPKSPKWSEWTNGNAYTSFVTLMALRPAEQDGEASTGRRDACWCFLSDHPAFSPGGFTRAFGGHVYAQSALAAARTVGPGFMIHVNSPPPYSSYGSRRELGREAEERFDFLMGGWATEGKKRG
jgi:hypothetical protein